MTAHNIPEYNIHSQEEIILSEQREKLKENILNSSINIAHIYTKTHSHPFN